ncbi:hypothetical protein BCR32DRAFT_291546 [Anaeromyces robustus]|uniref:Coth-domain-containing protein n=1 Tax=Anaeromyces robustus TaxID=1754192 RepID=A0A1Y1XEJ3_9FUNG|nr:hypothetical protein BCR32DRAFT_291546 [Anaeromyces robustus]|eukprot:ORX84127.1 hypothetical protein BCR32DRAFT_291546 [Anaeromyces robustus]
MKIISLFNLITSLALVSSKIVEKTNKDTNNLPTFNLASGFYDKKSIKLEIKNSDAKATIYYTLDGTIPTLNSTVYKKPIILRNKSNEENVLSNITKVSPEREFVPKVKVKKGNVIRAMAKLSDGTLTNVVSGTYFVGLNRKKATNNLPVVSIITDPANLFDYEKGIYIMGKRYDDWLAEDPENINKDTFQVEGNFSQKGKSSERPATIQYFPRKQNKVGFTQDLGIRIMGSASRTYFQKSFRFVNREDYGEKYLKYDLIPGNERSDGKGPVTKYKTFVLRNGGNDSEWSKIRDNVIERLLSDRGLEVQQNDMALAFIDGEYWGVYSINEDFSEHYIANNYDIDKDNVIIIKCNGNVNKAEAGEDSDVDEYNDQIKKILSMDLTQPTQYEEVANIFDMKEFAWYTAANLYICNVDGVVVGNNFSFWRVRNPDTSIPKADGKWRPLTYGMEFSIGLYMDGTNYDYDSFSFVNYFHDQYYYNQLITKFIENEEFKNEFVNALSDMRNIDFEMTRVNSTVEELRKQLSPIMKDHYDRFGEEAFIEENYVRFNNQVDIIEGWLNGRRAVFMEQVKNYFGFQPSVTVTVTSNNFKKGNFIVNNGWKIFDKKYKGEYFRENILYLTAKPKNNRRKLNYWEIKNCTFADEKYSNLANKSRSTQLTIGIYPDEGCKVTANFKLKQTYRMSSCLNIYVQIDNFGVFGHKSININTCTYIISCKSIVQIRCFDKEENFSNIIKELITNILFTTYIECKYRYRLSKNIKDLTLTYPQHQLSLVMVKKTQSFSQWIFICKSFEQNGNTILNDADEFFLKFALTIENKSLEIFMDLDIDIDVERNQWHELLIKGLSESPVLIINTPDGFKEVDIKKIRHEIYYDTDSNGILFVKWERELITNITNIPNYLWIKKSLTLKKKLKIFICKGFEQNRNTILKDANYKYIFSDSPRLGIITIRTLRIASSVLTSKR